MIKRTPDYWAAYSESQVFIIAYRAEQKMLELKGKSNQLSWFEKAFPRLTNFRSLNRAERVVRLIKNPPILFG